MIIPLSWDVLLFDMCATFHWTFLSVPPMHHPSTAPYDKSMFLVLRSDVRVMNHNFHWHKHHRCRLYQLPSLALLRKNKRVGEFFPKFHQLVGTAAHKGHIMFFFFLLSSCLVFKWLYHLGQTQRKPLSQLFVWRDYRSPGNFTADYKGILVLSEAMQ